MTDDLHITGTGKWRMPGVPQRGWTCEDIEDLAAPGFICEMCEVQEIRYVHTMWHPDYYETLRCGCICAGHMEQDLVAAKQREKIFKRRLSRRAHWLHRHWRTSGNGNAFLNTQDGFNVVVFQNGDTWGARFVDKETGYTRFSQRPYYSESAAKLAAFDAITGYKQKDGTSCGQRYTSFRRG
jgi:hypothetical protein